MSDNIQMLLEASNSINRNTVSFTRCLILALLAYFVDGLQYRELKSALDISDGKLASNLKPLKRLGYIRKEEVKLDRKRLDVYYLTQQGKRELDKITKWTEIVQNVVGE